jgi:glyoxylase I family protein
VAKAIGIGGVFLRSSNPEALSDGYNRHLGIDMSQGIWMQTAGPTVFAPFSTTDPCFETDRQVMLNFRVEDLDALLVQLSDADIAAQTRPDAWDGPHGRFARIHDCDGNPVELWEPPASAPE